uniref:Uncharacterized protein n=1 Tax=Heterorhabditis bacteriophora TaxID=37862 RepID=A0A1I7WP80_HETBA
MCNILFFQLFNNSCNHTSTCIYIYI